MVMLMLGRCVTGDELKYIGFENHESSKVKHRYQKQMSHADLS